LGVVRAVVGSVDGVVVGSVGGVVVGSVGGTVVGSVDGTVVGSVVGAVVGFVGGVGVVSQEALSTDWQEGIIGSRRGFQGKSVDMVYSRHTCNSLVYKHQVKPGKIRWMQGIQKVSGRLVQSAVP